MRKNLLSIGLVISTLGTSVAAAKECPTWIDVDTRSRTLTARRCDQWVEKFKNVALGRRGLNKIERGDLRTPIGAYRIGWINNKSQFHRFLGLTYPNTADGRGGAKRGLINRSELESIKAAEIRGDTPPQNTKLGGMVGIHGLGHRPVSLQQYDWTFGCIALTNTQIDRLMQWVHIGMWVIIH